MAKADIAKFSSRVNRLPFSRIASINSELQKLSAEGLDIVNLAMGNPSHALLDETKKAMIAEIEIGRIGYGATVGIDKLREEAAKITNEKYYGTNFTKDNVVVTPGSTLAIYAIQNIFLREGDLSLLITPTFPSYLPAIYNHHGDPIMAESLESEGFKPNIAAIKKCFTDAAREGKNIRTITLNYPNNPTGAVLSKEDAINLATCLNEMAEKHWGEQGFVLILDDVYKNFAFDQADSVSVYPFLSDKLRKNTVILDSASKTLAIAGERVGWAIGDSAIIDKIKSINSATVLNAPTIAQAGAAAGLKAIDDEKIKELSEYYRAKSNYISFRLDEIATKAGWPKMPIDATPEGSIFAFANLSAMIGKKIPEEIAARIGKTIIETDEDISRYLMLVATTKDTDNKNRIGVATVPGSGFALDPSKGFVRLCISGTSNTELQDDKMLIKAMDAFEEAVNFLEAAQTPSLAPKTTKSEAISVTPIRSRL